MDETEQKIIQIAEMYKNPDKFMYVLEKSFIIPPNEEDGFFLQVGITLYKFSYFHLAITSWNHALKYFIKNGNKMGELKCQANIGFAYSDLEKFKEAINWFEKSLEIAVEIEDKSEELKCYTNIGFAYYDSGHPEKAIEYCKKSLGTAQEIGDKSEESRCYTNIGNFCRNLGNFRKAIRYYEKSLKIARKIKDKAIESRCYMNLGIIYDDLGDLRKSIEYFEKSLKITQEIDNKSEESKCYANLGLVYYDLGYFKKAIEYHKKSLKIAVEIQDKTGKFRCYTNLGLVYHGLGDFRKALEYCEKSLELAQETGNRIGESKCIMILGATYDSLGDFTKAIKYYEKSLRIAQEIGDRSEESKCYTNLGLAYSNLRDFRKAIKCYKKSLQIAVETGDRSRESDFFMNLGNIYYRLGDFKEAIKCYKKSLEISQEVGNRSGEAKSYANLGNAYHDLRDYEKAIEKYEASLEVIRETGDINSERIASLNLGLAYYEHNPERAYSYCRRSIDLSEMMIGNLVEEQHKIGFAARTYNAYQWVIPLCLTLKKEKEVFEYTERGKSRAFLDVLAATEIRPTVEVTSELQSLLDDEEMYLARLREIQTRHLRPIKISVEPGEVEMIYENLTQIYNEIERYDPEYVFTRRGKPLSLDDLQDILSSQNRNTVLIEYFITENETFILTISSRDHQFHIRTVPLPAETFNQYVKEWRKVAISLDLQNISRYLIEPVSDYLNEGDLIYFVPYGPLHYFPLHALTLNGEPLTKIHPVAYLPSASILPFCQNKGTGTLKTCASFGVSFVKEAKDIAALFNTEAYLDDLATKENVKTCNKDIIHFACHGKFDDKDPLSSRVQLHDGELTARDIFNMRLTTELVTLSACETGYNERSPGDELIGLTRAFLYAGTPSVIVSLWPVYGPPTQELMTEFYRQLKNSKDKATALQKAQIKIMESEKYSHPYFWAPFILIGNWK